jgi:hypothetical protein
MTDIASGRVRKLQEGIKSALSNSLFLLGIVITESTFEDLLKDPTIKEMYEKLK